MLYILGLPADRLARVTAFKQIKDTGISFSLSFKSLLSFENDDLLYRILLMLTLNKTAADMHLESYLTLDMICSQPLPSTILTHSGSQNLCHWMHLSVLDDSDDTKVDALTSAAW
jgi:hypothetical protein